MEHGKVILTDDGSNTIVSPIFNERYHSAYGARTESQVVFIDAGLEYFSDKAHVSILEMGFGSGLNAYMSWIWAHAKGKTATYVGYEKYPVESKLLDTINYQSLFLTDALSFSKLHDLTWEERHQVDERFLFSKIKADIDALQDSLMHDVIFYDAFAPNAQPELWEIPIFEKMYNSLVEGGILVTYCAKGQVKRNLKAAGFRLESLPGPPGKREMTRAIK